MLGGRVEEGGGAALCGPCGRSRDSLSVFLPWLHQRLRGKNSDLAAEQLRPFLPCLGLSFLPGNQAG